VASDSRGISFVVRRDASVPKPIGDFPNVESKKPAPLVKRNPALADETTDVPYGDSKVLRKILDRDQLRDFKRSTGGGNHR
jgi:hypothetical protein